MPTINNTFDVRFELSGSISLVLTDTTLSAPEGMVGIFSITQPDGYTRTGNISSPDISVAGGSYTFTLTRDSLGNVQCGTYTIKYTATAPGYLGSEFTRTFIFQYNPVAQSIGEEFDVFTPNLSVRDNTSYAVSGFTTTSTTRAWSISSTPTGVLTGSDIIQSLIKDGSYYSANYSISLTSSILYTHQTYGWLTVSQTLVKTLTACVETPPDFISLVTQVTDLKSELDAAVNTCQTYDKLQEKFEYAVVLLTHILNKIKTGDDENIYENLEELLKLLNTSHTCSPTNQIIPAYNIGGLDGTAWGTITGNIQLQTDLWTIIQDLYAGIGLSGRFAQNIGDGVNTSYTVTHSLDTRDVDVSIYSNSTFAEVFTDVAVTTVNTVTITFKNAPTTNAYRVVIKK